MPSPQIVVTAASGKLGRAVTAELLTHGDASQIRLAVRTPEVLDDLLPLGIEVVPGDYDDPVQLRSAFDGAEAVLMISSVGANEQRIRQHRNVIAAAKAAGLKRLVYTSATNPVPDSRFEWAGAHVFTERHLREVFPEATLLRNNSYFSNHDPLFEQAKAGSTLAFPGADAKVAYVTHEDIAAAAVTALTQPGHEGQTYEISGDQAWTARELAAILGDLLGRPIEVADVPLKAFHDHFESMGLPQHMVTGLTSFYATLAAGEYANTSSDIQRLCGRPSTSAADYLRRFV